MANLSRRQGKRSSTVAIERLRGVNVMNVMNVSLTLRVREKGVSENTGCRVNIHNIHSKGGLVSVRTPLKPAPGLGLSSVRGGTE